MRAVFDLVVSVVGLLLLSPAFAVIAVAIKLDSPGPVIYRQVRVGKGGRLFTILKFRSIVEDADRIAPNVSPTGDARVTRVGAFLRHWYLDELPQLVNVLKGDMSLVCPRPETPEFVALYTDDELRVLDVKPGLVGPSTVAFMDEGRLLAASEGPESYYATELVHARVRLDLEYATRETLRSDLRILARQGIAIFRQRRGK